MSPLNRVMTRLVIDPAFRQRLLDEPSAALADYDLDPADVQALTHPGPHWMGLAARVLREWEVPDGPSWDPNQQGAGPTAPPQTEAEPWPDARLVVALQPVEHPDGSPGWQASLHADSEQIRGELRPTLAVAVRVEAHPRPHATAEILHQPNHDGIPGSIDGGRWNHRPPRDLQPAAAAVLESAPADREAALVTYLGAVTGRGAVQANVGPPSASPPTPDGPADITVVGLGMTGVEHITREAEAAIRAAKEVLYVEARVGVHAFLSERCPRVTPLFGQTYAGWRPRLQTYDHLAARVLDAALDHGPIVLAVQGHPTVYSYVPVLLRDAAPALGLRVVIQPGISVEACIQARLGIDPADHGMQSFEATDLLLRRRLVQPDMATLIWQVGNLETRLHSARPSRPERLLRLVAYLGRTFPPDHPVAAVHVPTLPAVEATVLRTTLGELPTIAARLHAATTLYLPPAGRRHIADGVLAALVDDPAHLERSTQPLDPSQP